ncbi:type II toxin-antitoxin system HicA family toxin [Nocardiopsis sp. NPDC049922]|uniref:type II toxin-antitoxin system HicA family toxin n=1 Tax=Nocardiopsis sp. NPDC049922 TaxID=3155157 RepID=UPI0033FF1F3F
MGAPKLLRLLKRELGYEEVQHNGGSHRWLEAPERERIRWAYHDGRELSPIEVKKVLVNQAGLSLEEARKVVQRA